MGTVEVAIAWIVPDERGVQRLQMRDTIAQTTDTLGLVVVTVCDRTWQVNHQASGMRVASAPTKNEARALARTLGEGIDWGRDFNALLEDNRFLTVLGSRASSAMAMLWLYPTGQEAQYRDRAGALWVLDDAALPHSNRPEKQHAVARGAIAVQEPPCGACGKALGRVVFMQQDTDGEVRCASCVLVVEG